MNQDDGGKPHVQFGPVPPEDQHVERLYVLISVTEDGGEGIYGQFIEGRLMTFVVHQKLAMEALESHIRSAGSIEVARRDKVRLEWRTYEQVGESDVIT